MGVVPMYVDNLQLQDAVTLDLQGGAAVFNGKCAHAAEPSTNERCSVIRFSCVCSWPRETQKGKHTHTHKHIHTHTHTHTHAHTAGRSSSCGNTWGRLGRLGECLGLLRGGLGRLGKALGMLGEWLGGLGRLFHRCPARPRGLGEAWGRLGGGLGEAWGGFSTGRLFQCKLTIWGARSRIKKAFPQMPSSS